MDGFFKNVNQKVNLGKPNVRRQWYRYVKGQIFEKPVQKNNFGCTSVSLQGW